MPDRAHLKRGVSGNAAVADDATEPRFTRGTVPALLADAVAAAPEKPYLVTESGELTYAQVDAATGSVAGALRHLGVARGDRVLAAMTGTSESVVLFLALARLGAMLVPVSPRAAPSEVAGAIRQSRPALVVVPRTVTNLGEAVSLPDHRTVVVELEDLVAGSNHAPPVAAMPEDGLVLIGTSGSTSAPKLVEQCHSAVVLGAEGFPSWLGLTASDRLFTTLPLFHGNALLYSVLGSVSVGASLAMVDRFSASSFWHQTREFGVTQFNLMGNMGEILLATPERPDDTSNPVRLCYGAWAPPRERHRHFETRFGLDMIVGYGLSESMYGMVWPLGGMKPYGTLGRPRQHPTLGVINEVRLVDESGQPVAIGEPGELLLRNPTVMHGYFGMPDETAQVIDADGWLYTGDLLRLGADGYYSFVGRRKDVIRRSGENFAPIELEEAIDQHPGVVASAVVPVPAAMYEDDAKAFVVRAEHAGAPVTAAEIVEWCRDLVSTFKLPRYIEFVDALPMTDTGRIAKGQLSRERTEREDDVEHLRRAVPRS